MGGRSQGWRDFDDAPCTWLDKAPAGQPILKAKFKLANARQTLADGETLRDTFNTEGIAPFDYFYTLYVWPKQLSDTRLILPVQSYHSEPFDAAERFLRKNRGWHRDTFEVQFRELAGIAREYIGVDLKTTENILAAEEKRSGDSLDAFGLKFPAETAIRWGIGALIIIMVQLYLWAHLFEFRRKLSASDEGWDVAWVGVYETRPARILLYASLVLFPVAGNAALGIRGLFLSHFAWHSWAVLTASVAAGLFISGLTCLAPAEERRVAQRPAAEDSGGNSGRMKNSIIRLRMLPVTQPKIGDGGYVAPGGKGG